MFMEELLNFNIQSTFVSETDKIVTKNNFLVNRGSSAIFLSLRTKYFQKFSCLWNLKRVGFSNLAAESQKVCNFIEMRLWHRCFRIFKNTFFIEHLAIAS